MAAVIKSRKILLEKRPDKKKLAVTFAKRRRGLFNKAGELFLFCDAQLAVVISSPHSEKLYCFGHPSVDAVLDAYLENRHPNRPDIALQQSAHFVKIQIDQLQKQLTSPKLIDFDFEVFDNSDSVYELQELVNALEKLVDRAKRRRLNEKNQNGVYSNELGFCNSQPVSDILFKNTSPITNNGFKNCDLMASQPMEFGFNTNYNHVENNLLPLPESCFSYNNHVLLREKEADESKTIDDRLWFY